ncbi:hypothetical protein acsn021_41780 [Anaerocolumna cellulosilytica]|uniref:Uncharacterized protein n=1 Tax=Anaerocolumna cellulosilytica TaxID=433286 RepID=A0A6S6R5J7_9FIRM|nr:S24/S26 family peptidase [Anaerocolumna cellulosilytica]MBB5195138.1 hypothetical protein [Anaerocolumna cellulosilytica]BCJ96609.1 hypothetical protein acsn021_41780 [Anaerocolumna cellulosilytica]
MSDIKYLKIEKMMPVIKELLNAGGRVRITVTGMSMYPFLRGGKDSVTLAGTDFACIKSGDIVLIQRKNKQYVLHRVMKKTKVAIYLCGDAEQWCEGPIYPEQFAAKAEGIWREEKYIECTHKLLQALVFMWRLAFPIRIFLIRFNGRLRNIRQSIKRRRGCI